MPHAQPRPKVVPFPFPAAARKAPGPTDEERQILDLYRELDDQGRTDMRLFMLVCRKISGALQAREEGSR